jgi:hypothetical protein
MSLPNHQHFHRKMGVLVIVWRAPCDRIKSLLWMEQIIRPVVSISCDEQPFIKEIRHA